MRGTREAVKSVKQQGLERLNAMFDAGKGTSKHIDMKSGRGLDGKIYSHVTKQTYIEAWVDFCEAMKAAGYKCNGHSPRTLEEAIGFVPAYIEILKARPGRSGAEHMSAWTIHTKFSGVAKVLGLSATDYDLPKRHTEDIRRSRTVTTGDKHFSIKNNRELITFCQTCGLRDVKELRSIRGTDLLQREDGRMAIHVKGKGGRERDAGLYGTPDEIELVVRKMREAGNEIVWPNIHSNADIHSYRADYAVRIYKEFARDPYSLPRKERYCCQGSKRGIWYDRAALRIVSRELGHARVNVVAENYLYKLDSASERQNDDRICHSRSDSRVK